MLEARSALGGGDRKRFSVRMFSGVAALPEYRAAGTVLAYCGFGDEPDTVSGFIGSVLAEGRRLVLPRVDRERGTLVLHEVCDPDSELVAGVWGIQEPEPGLPEVPLSDVDFVLMPGVAFDRRGGRLGYGGGYYDRLLGGSAPRPPLVAAAFEAQVVGSVPTEHHDIRFDVLVTEAGVWRTDGAPRKPAWNRPAGSDPP